MRISILVALVVGLLPVAALGAGGHDMVGCNGCHRQAKPNTKYLNPKTMQPYTGATALCFACHQDEEHGGQGYAPISQHVSHPFDVAQVNPKVARVPDEFLREGRFGCTSCHEPHPANHNYKYLRVDIGKDGRDMERFCSMCHASKADAAAASAAPVQGTAERSGAPAGGNGQKPAAPPKK